MDVRDVRSEGYIGELEPHSVSLGNPSIIPIVSLDIICDYDDLKTYSSHGRNLHVQFAQLPTIPIGVFFNSAKGQSKPVRFFDRSAIIRQRRSVIDCD